jgi:NAD(P)-dependent dehydrogenase (short-subunit alcohol dehydrogenase family)
MFEGKVAIVTGSGGGIGRETALLLAKQGAKVIVNDLGSSVIGEGKSSAPAEETARMIKDGGGEAAVSTDSVSDWKSAHRIVQAALDAFGRLDIVINNAGNVRWSPFWETDEDSYRSIVGAHLDGTFFVSRAAAPHFVKQKSGVYVHTTSTSGLMGHHNQAHYCESRHSRTFQSHCPRHEALQCALQLHRAVRIQPHGGGCRSLGGAHGSS